MLLCFSICLSLIILSLRLLNIIMPLDFQLRVDFILLLLRMYLIDMRELHDTLLLSYLSQCIKEVCSFIFSLPYYRNRNRNNNFQYFIKL